MKLMTPAEASKSEAERKAALAREISTLTDSVAQKHNSLVALATFYDAQKKEVEADYLAYVESISAKKQGLFYEVKNLEDAKAKLMVELETLREALNEAKS